MRFFLRFVLLVNLFLLSSCKKYKPADQAFFIKAKKISITTTPLQGSANHKITDLWFYVDYKFKGSYPVGSLMPAAWKGGSAVITVLPGIKNNGISDLRIPYPFYELLQFDTLVETGKTIERDFTFTYKSITNFVWMEDFNFNGSGYTVKLSDGYKSSFKISSPEESYEGKSIKVELASDDTLETQIESSGNFSLPTGSSNVYLELNYKCNTIFDIGLIGNNNPQLKNALTLNPSEDWNKIYIQLSSAVSTAPVSNKYKVYFHIVKSKGEGTKKFYLDNIKLLYM
jgi:hypothetical protein